MTVALYILLGVFVFIWVMALLHRRQEPTAHGYILVSQLALIAFFISCVLLAFLLVMSIGWFGLLFLLPYFFVYLVIGAAF